MERSHSKRFAAILLSVTMTVIGFAPPGGWAEDISVKLIVNPSRTDIYLGSEAIALTARARGKNLSYSWDLTGSSTAMFPENDIYCLSGFSENTFDVMQTLEIDKKDLIFLINQIKWD